MRISKKLQVESLIVLLLLVGSLCISFFSIRSIESGIDLFEETRLGVADANNYEKQLLRLFTVTLDIMLSEEGEIDGDRLIDLRLTGSRLRKAGRDLKKRSILQEETSALVQDLNNFSELIETELINPIYIREEVDMRAVRNILYAEYDRVSGRFRALEESYLALADRESEKIHASARLSLLLIFVFFLAAFITSLLLTLVNRRGIVKPIRSTVSLLEEFSQGEADLSRRLPVESRDEIGALCGNLNLFLDSLSESVAAVRGISNESLGISESLSTNTHQTSGEIKRIEQSLKEMKSHIGTLAPEVSRAAQSAEEISTNAEHVRTQAESQQERLEVSAKQTSATMGDLETLAVTAREKLKTSQELAGTTEQGAALAEELNQGIEGVHATTDVILETISLITAVSDQTRILSMNAAIEAAHAGDAGKGFAVIAEEIRRLSETTGESTGSIVRDLESVTSQLELLLRESTESLGIFQRIKSETEEFTASFRQLAQQVDQAAEWGNRMIEEFDLFSTAGREFERIAGTMSSGAADIESITRQIQERFSPFLEEIEGIIRSGEEISRAAAEVEALSDVNREHVASIDETLARFSDGQSRP